jgi:uncharacterized protein with HEPN domain
MISPTFRVQDYLQHIIEAIDRISAYTTGLDQTAFMSDAKTQDAVIRNLQVIGEAAIRTSSHQTPPSLGVRPTVCAMR